MEMEKPSTITAEVMADLEEVCRQAATGGVRDTDLIRRVSERAEKVRQETVKRLGVQDIGVQIIREMRNGS
jgi:hypothetical protein